MAIKQLGRGSLRRHKWVQQIGRFCDVWLCASNRSPKTVRAYRADLKQFARHARRSTGPLRVRRALIEEWVAKLQREEYASSSIRRKLASLRAFFGYLVAAGKSSSSPMADLRIRL